MLLVLLKGANEGHVIAFFKEHLGYILGVVSQPVDRDTDSLDDLHMKANCLCFMQAYCNLIPTEVIGHGGELDNVWVNCKENKGHTAVRQEMSKVMKGLHAAIKHDITRLTPERREAIINFHREAVNAFGTFVMRVVNKEKLYEAVFRMGSTDFIWDALIDPEEPIYLDMLFAQPLLKKKLDAFFNSKERKNNKAERPSIYYMDSIDIMGSRYLVLKKKCLF